VTPAPDPDPPLSALGQQGKVVFNRACAQCHAGLSGTLPSPGIHRFGGIQTQCPRPVDFMSPPRWQFAPCPERLLRNARTYEITQSTGEKIRRTSSDPGRTLLSGFAGGPPPLDDWNALDVPSTRGIGRTRPYFHNNSAATLEHVPDHYTEFFKFVAANGPPPPAPLPPVISSDGVNVDRPFTRSERPALLAYLRKL
jgi:cytochrome c peroxidase